MDVYNNNIWLVETIARAATDNHWPRVDVKAGNVVPGRQRRIPGRGEEPDEQGARLQDSRASVSPATGRARGRRPTRRWTPKPGRTASTRTTSSQQVAGLSQIAGELMQVKPIVIDLGWGELKTAVMALKDPAALAQYVGRLQESRGGKTRAGAQRAEGSRGEARRVEQVD